MPIVILSRFDQPAQPSSSRQLFSRDLRLLQQHRSRQMLYPTME
jgi:hypothetical protein